VTEFGSFDNSTCKRVLDLLELGNLRLGQVVIKRVAVVELGVNNGSGDTYLGNHSSDLRQICTHIIWIRGSVLLWRRCGTLCTSGRGHICT